MASDNFALDLLVVWIDVDSVKAELGEVSSAEGVVGLFKDLLEKSDPRAKALPMRFPTALSTSLVSVMARGLLYGTGVNPVSTAHVVVLADDGRVLDLGLPADFLELAPKLKEAVSKQE
jgi:hypothetical protein